MAELVSHFVHMLMGVALWVIGAAGDTAEDARAEARQKVAADAQTEMQASEIHAMVLEELRRAERDAQLTAEQAQAIAEAARRAASPRITD